MGGPLAGCIALSASRVSGVPIGGVVGRVAVRDADVDAVDDAFGGRGPAVRDAAAGAACAGDPLAIGAAVRDAAAAAANFAVFCSCLRV